MNTGPVLVTDHRAPVVADPAPDTPVFPAVRARPGYPIAEIPRFGADHWQLAGLDHRHTAGSVAIRWYRFPLPLRAAFKRGCWLLINMPTPAVLHQRPRSATKALLNPKSVNAVCLAWLRSRSGWPSAASPGWPTSMPGCWPTTRSTCTPSTTPPPTTATN
jgi:hypothetical protein